MSEEGTPGLEHVSKDVQCKFALFLKGKQKGHCISTAVILKLSLTQGFFSCSKFFCRLSVGNLFEIRCSLRCQELRVFEEVMAKELRCAQDIPCT